MRLYKHPNIFTLQNKFSHGDLSIPGPGGVVLSTEMEWNRTKTMRRCRASIPLSSPRNRARFRITSLTISISSSLNAKQHRLATSISYAQTFTIPSYREEELTIPIIVPVLEKFVHAPSFGYDYLFNTNIFTIFSFFFRNACVTSVFKFNLGKKIRNCSLFLSRLKCTTLRLTIADR